MRIVEESGRALVYVVEGFRYAVLPEFTDGTQNVSGATPSKLPAPPASVVSPAQNMNLRKRVRKGCRPKALEDEAYEELRVFYGEGAPGVEQWETLKKIYAGTDMGAVVKSVIAMGRDVYVLDELKRRLAG